MSRITLISASAGTGKTTRLARALTDALTDTGRQVTPERVVAMTFTRAAAADLDARVRRALIEAQHLDLARRLGAARIGTVHAVCASLVRDFSFELGLLPELVTLEEGDAAVLLRAALVDAAHPDEVAVLDDISRRCWGFDWVYAVGQLCEQARQNAVEHELHGELPRRSRESLLAALPDPGEATVLDDALRSAVANALTSEPAQALNRQQQDDQALLRQLHESLQRGEVPAWHLWLRAGGLRGGVGEAAKAHVRHPRLRRDLTEAIQHCFVIASRALARYAELKQAQGVVDFADLEVHALRLLSNPDHQKRLREQIDLVLVDEFQDTSPIQLAIFTRLRTIALESVWVGDQKQSIYGFRGTDPRLMDAVVEEMKLEGVHERLDHSYRSRKPLSDVTSRIFGRAFESTGIPRADVDLQAAYGDDPALGPAFERWPMGFGDDEATALADGVCALLADESVNVRDRETGAIRRATAKDIAILSRTREGTWNNAAALLRRGVRVRVMRPGLGATPEARLVVAGLRLWLDVKDAGAQLELLRLLVHGDDGNAWLADALAAGEAPPAPLAELLDAMADAAREHETASPVVAFDQVVELLDVPRQCAAWGDGAQRRANVSALRASLVRSVGRAYRLGTGPTLAGFIAACEERAARAGARGVEDRDDVCGAVEGTDAVDLVTWHAAKGLEWPIVVLGQLAHESPGSPFGVHVEADDERVRVSEPLHGRWVRLWPSPYRSRSGKHGLFAALAGHPFLQRATKSHLREELRLLYVGWTRARDRLVLPGPSTIFTSGALTRLQNEQGGLFLDEVGGTGAEWLGLKVPVLVRRLAQNHAVEAPLVEERVLPRVPPVEHPRMFVAPSSALDVGEASPAETLGPTLSLKRFAADEEMNHLGQAVHGFFAVDLDPSGDASTRLARAQRLLTMWQVDHLLDAADILQCANALWRYLDVRFPGARIVREEHVTHRLPSGSVVRGQIDLLVWTDAGAVIVDHKTYPGLTELEERARTFAGQLRTYAAAVTAATGQPVLHTLIHFPLSAAVVEVR